MLSAKQISMLAYTLVEKDKNVGSLTWPDAAEATNARLKRSVPRERKDAQLVYQDQSYSISFEYLTRDFNNDIRFYLMQQNKIIASVEVVKSGKFAKRPTITITQPFIGKLEKKSRLLKTHYDVVVDQQVVGHIAEKPKLSLNRELYLELPETIAKPIQCFLLYVVCNHAYSM